MTLQDDISLSWPIVACSDCNLAPVIVVDGLCGVKKYELKYSCAESGSIPRIREINNDLQGDIATILNDPEFLKVAVDAANNDVPTEYNHVCSESMMQAAFIAILEVINDKS